MQLALFLMILCIAGCASDAPRFDIKQDGVTVDKPQVESGATNYDRTLINEITTRWFDLMDKRDAQTDQTGIVIIQFRLWRDGKVTDIKLVKSNVARAAAEKCIQAINDCSPFEPWSVEMKKRSNREFREVDFTFHLE
jgi:hypothetical protein